MGWLARFVDARTRAASAVDSAPAMPPGATLEGVAGYLDQYQQTGPAHLFAADEGPNATHARDLFDHAVRTGALIERDGWFQPASCADACESPYANPASRALLGVENMFEAEAMAEGQLDMIAGTSGVATLQIMRGVFKRFKLNPPDSAPWLDGMPARQLPVDEHKVPTPDVSLPHTQRLEDATEAIELGDDVEITTKLLLDLDHDPNEWFFDVVIRTEDRTVSFGIFDSSFMFVEGPPDLVRAVGSGFNDTTEVDWAIDT